jgi:hypothetical protein
LGIKLPANNIQSSGGIFSFEDAASEEFLFAASQFHPTDSLICESGVEICAGLPGLIGSKNPKRSKVVKISHLFSISETVQPLIHIHDGFARNRR